MSSDKVWGVMNDLEMTTSKICYAREIIDIVAQSIQERNYEKAENLAMAAYEFLGYYLNEFDEKFKLAWKETVVHKKQLNQSPNTTLECEKDDQSPECKKAWSSFWEENYYPHEYEQHTKDELNSMCDVEKNSKPKRWVLPIEIDGPSGEYFICLPDDLLDAANLKEGDELEWVDQEDGSCLLKKVVKRTEKVIPDNMTWDQAMEGGWSMTDDGFWIPPSK